jgi:(1->4)-alpha-D-glucan 1-alpha-D-glucosylmutase
MAEFRVPAATYRVQFHLNLRFRDARDLVPYLHELGVTDLYASPRFKARKGSSHGYDVADPQRINSELGTEEEFKELAKKLESYRMGLLLDIVPNHMAASSENPWWMDLLENGPSSAYASYFDIDWHPATSKAVFLQENKVLLPVLGDLYGKALENQEIILALDERGFFFRYYDARLPLDPKSYRPILEHCLERLRESAPGDPPRAHQLAALLDAIDRLPVRTTSDPERVEERRAAAAGIKQGLWRLYHGETEVREQMEETIRLFNGTRGVAESFDLLDRLLADQAYRLAFWKIAAEEINYRRFFDINDLVGLRVEDPEVFEARHAPIVRLIHAGEVTGLRVDHVDGLYDPLGYLERLQGYLKPAGGRPEPPRSQNLFVIVEKILGENEVLPPDWPVAGTTGYDFVNAVNGLWVDPGGLAALEKSYAAATRTTASFADACYAANKLVMRQLFPGEVRALGHHLGKLAAQDRRARDLPLSELVEALVETTACLPIYRTYVRSYDLERRDLAYLERALRMARSRTPPDRASDEAFAFLGRVLLLELPHGAREREPEWLRFVMRWQQFTAPVMAKGLEDTAFYLHNSLVSLNEVGGDPVREDPPFDPEAFHLFNQERREGWPHTLNATSTHDSKRSEDVRARIDVLSELAREWTTCLRRWSRWNHARKHAVGADLAPRPSEEILLYQTMLGAWPLDEKEQGEFAQRLIEFAIKAAREAKTRSNWISPDAAHEAALRSFIEAILDTSEENRFLADFLLFEKQIAFYGAINSLAQVALKIAAPGVADFYQGTEVWNLRMVDPDNRRPVDFAARAQLLDELKGRDSEGSDALLHELLERWQDGRIKLYVTWKALNFRRAHQNLFSAGEYIPLHASRGRDDHVCAFARRAGDDWAIVAVPRLVTRLTEPGVFPLGKAAWGSAAINLPKDAPAKWKNVFSGRELRASFARQNKRLALRQVFDSAPVALLAGSP